MAHTKFGKSGTMREVRQFAVCCPERRHHGKCLCSICSQRYWKAIRVGAQPDPMLARIVSNSDARERSRRTAAAEGRTELRSGELTQGRVRQLFDYDQDLGVLRWRVSPVNGISVGDIAGYRSDRYIAIEFDGRHHGVHRVIWLWMTGEMPPEIDHRNLNTFDNKWANLREATHSQNMWNKGRYKNNTSGFKGVSFHAQSGKWRATITVSGEHISLGLHPSKEGAARAYREAAEKHHGEFARVA